MLPRLAAYCLVVVFARINAADCVAKEAGQKTRQRSVVFATLEEALGDHEVELTLWGYLLTHVSPHPRACVRTGSPGLRCCFVTRLVLKAHCQVGPMVQSPKARLVQGHKPRQPLQFHGRSVAFDRLQRILLHVAMLAALMMTAMFVLPRWLWTWVSQAALQWLRLVGEGLVLLLCQRWPRGCCQMAVVAQEVKAVGAVTFVVCLRLHLLGVYCQTVAVFLEVMGDGVVVLVVQVAPQAIGELPMVAGQHLAPCD